MKRLHLILLILSSVLFVSCQKEQSIEKSNLKEKDINPTSYLLRKITIEHAAATNGQYFYFDYNSNHQVDEMKRIQWGNRDINVTPIQKWYDTNTCKFTYQNGLPVRCTLSDRFGVFRIMEYVYQGKQLRTRIQKYDDATIDRYDHYRYDPDGRLMEVVDSSDKVDFRFVFEYRGNLTAVTTYNLQSNPQKKSRTEYDNFDTKVNFIKAVNVLPETFESDGINIGAYSSFSANNYGLKNHYWDVEINQNFNAPTGGTYIYEYNEDGLPTRKQYGGMTWTFEYQKYK